jgi:transcriptional regulator of NAD metabolism
VKGKERREKIINDLMMERTPVSAGTLAKKYGVSRQVVVQDVALLRAQGLNIQSTSSGYLLDNAVPNSRVFKSIHSDEETAEELTICVDLGGCVKDVFVYHRAYGVVRADLNISSRLDIQRFLESVSTGHSHFLKNITSGYHYHTVIADSKEVLDLIQQALTERGFLAPLTDYEPVDFNGED